MHTRHKHKPHSTSRHPKALPEDRVRAPNGESSRVLIIETLHAAEDIIRVSIETARSQRLPERVIVF